MQACIASLLEIPIDDAPDVCNGDDPDNWLARLMLWLKPRGYFACYIHPITPCSAAVEGPCILGCQTDPPLSPANPGWGHAVVGHCRIDSDGMVNFDVTFDPNPNGRPIAKLTDAVFIVRNAVPGGEAL